MFTPAAKGLSGFGSTVFGLEKSPPPTPKLQFKIVDKVKIPKDLEPGKYVLGFRWDVEQTAQVWTSCADIIIS